VPPTWFETHTSVMSASVSGIFSSSAKVSSTGRSTMPSIVSVQVSGDTLLDRHGGQVDGGLADRGDRSAVRPGDRGRQLGYAQRHGPRQQSG